ncbi:SMARCB1 [Chionoecetes opilio]|uniref:SMARCB1 n=1 Tax=Chionoecetes opilio TaxID=41210 RepID=A0A8J4Y221_CHIOP|nr:SMARCB1 [Chionoecetes opilio]
MYRRSITNDERKKLMELGRFLGVYLSLEVQSLGARQRPGSDPTVLASNISLLRASEVEDIIEGNEEKYKAVSVRQQQDPEAAAARAERQVKKPSAPWVPTISNSSHLDAVPQATPINRNRIIAKKIRTFPMWCVCGCVGVSECV